MDPGSQERVCGKGEELDPVPIPVIPAFIFRFLPFEFDISSLRSPR
jgi:hypothetical protein